MTSKQELDTHFEREHFSSAAAKDEHLVLIAVEPFCVVVVPVADGNTDCDGTLKRTMKKNIASVAWDGHRTSAADSFGHEEPCFVVGRNVEKLVVACYGREPDDREDYDDDVQKVVLSMATAARGEPSAAGGDDVQSLVVVDGTVVEHVAVVVGEKFAFPALEL